jgi:hypothetical protein
MRNWLVKRLLFAALIVWGGLSFAHAAPIGDDPCLTKVKSVKAINQTASTNYTTSSNLTKTVLCSFGLYVAPATTALLQLGGAALCTTTPTPVTGPLGDPTVATTYSSGQGAGIAVGAQVNTQLCVIETGTGQVSGWFTYVLVTP